MKYLVSKLLLIGLLNGCNVSKQYSFENYTLANCRGDSKTFTLPTGWSKVSSHYTPHGNIESLIYPDSSIVSILCATSTELNLGDIFENKKSRKEIIFGRTILYENVPANRKGKFDAAFDEMLKEKPVPNKT